MPGTTSGTPLLDTLIDGVHTGDNVVLLGDPDAPLDLLVDRFVASVRGSLPLVLVNLVTPGQATVADGVTVLDWSAPTTGAPSPFANGLAPDAGLAEALASLAEVDATLGPGAAFVFDPLSALPERWGPDAALEIFLATCPRLYRRESLALWPIRRDRHRPTFLRRLEDVTQVVVDVACDGADLELTVRKADGRHADLVGRSVRAQVLDGAIRSVGEPTGTRQRLSSAIRERRLALSLSQTEVARRVGITPSALSQVERGVRGPSGETLNRLWEVLDVPFGPATADDPGYLAARRSGRERSRLQHGLDGERLAQGPGDGSVWRLEFGPGASAAQTPFPWKGQETVVVVRGLLELQMGTRSATLHEGDALQITSAAVTGWANPGPRTAEVLWVLHRPD